MSFVTNSNFTTTHAIDLSIKGLLVLMIICLIWAVISTLRWVHLIDKWNKEHPDDTKCERPDRVTQAIRLLTV